MQVNQNSDLGAALLRNGNVASAHDRRMVLKMIADASMADAPEYDRDLHLQ